MSKSQNELHHITRVLIFAVVLGLIIGVINVLLTSSSWTSSTIALFYTFSIALAILTAESFVFPPLSTLQTRPWIRFMACIFIGAATYFITTKAISVINPDVLFTWNPKRLFISLGVAALIGTYSIWISRNRPANNHERPPKDFLSVRLHDKIKLVSFEQITFLEAQDKYVNIHTPEQVYLTGKTLSELIQLLPAHFVQIHRSAIVNRNFIQEIQKMKRGLYSFIMPNGAQLKSGHTYKQKLRDLFEE